MSVRFTTLVLAAVAALAVPGAPPLANSRMTIVNVNAPGEGFNDPTPAVPVGGNSGTTVGEQRRLAFAHAAGIWASKLDSAVEIFIVAAFVALPCGPTGAVLGAAGSADIVADFPGAQRSGTLYPIATANKLARTDLRPPGGLDPGYDLYAVFNAGVDSADCLGSRSWYYGLDSAHGTDIDLVTVLLHEFAHGLGFISFVDPVTGDNPDPEAPDTSDVFSSRLRDGTTGLHWHEMTPAERQTSAVNARALAWDGEEVSAAVPGVLARGVPALTVLSPAGIAGRYSVGPATFGAALQGTGITADIALAVDPEDAAGPSTSDACSPLSNAAEIAGRIALMDRGACAFSVKVKNAQDAGAIAAVVVDNTPLRPPSSLAGSDPTITIPAVRITRDDGNRIRAELAAGVTATLGVDFSLYAGADGNDRALLHATDPVQLGSSISHWDTIATPNQLMEPVLNTDLTHAVDGVDLTLAQLRDVGWFPDEDLDGVENGSDQCAGSDPRPQLVVRRCRSGVPNEALGGGCNVADEIERCWEQSHHHRLRFEYCVTSLVRRLRREGVLTARQRQAVLRCLQDPHRR